MRGLRLLALAAALVVPAAAAHAQVGVYVGSSVRYAAPVYGPGFDARYHVDHRRAYVGGPWIAPRAYPVYGIRPEWRRDRVWVHDGRYARGGRW